MPVSYRLPPIANDGSSWHAWAATVSSEVVVVLPWVPEIAIMRRSSSAEDSAAARRRNGLPLFRAATNSGWAGLMAVVYTNVSVASTCCGRVTDLDVRTERPQRRNGGRIARFAAGDRDATFDEDAGQRAHPGSGDAHDVHPAQRGQGRNQVGRGAPYQRRARRRPVSRSIMISVPRRHVVARPGRRGRRLHPTKTRRVFVGTPLLGALPPR